MLLQDFIVRNMQKALFNENMVTKDMLYSTLIF